MLQRRSIRRVGARLALLAVWLQIVLTLGHIHPSDIYLYGHPVVQGQGVARFAMDRHATPIPLTPQSDNEAADQACSVCANMSLAGALILPAPLGIERQTDAVLAPAATAIPLRLSAAPYLFFQTRAPPSA